MKKYLSPLLTILGIFFYCTSEQEVTTNTIIARIGKSTITKIEFENRLEFSTRLSKTGTDADQKQQLLAALIAEKMMAQIACEQKFDTLNTLKATIRQMQKEAVIEALFDQEIEEKVKISEPEIQQALQRLPQVLKVKYFKVADKNEARLAKEELKQGKSFEKTGALHGFHDSAKSDSLPQKLIKWGEATQVVEDSVFALNPNEFTGPIQVDHEYYFFKLIDKQQNPTINAGDAEKWRPYIIQRIKRKRRTTLFSQFIVQLLQNTKATVPQQKFKAVADMLETSLAIGTEDTGNLQIGPEQPLAEKGFEKIQQTFQSRLNEPFILFSDGTSWTIHNFLENLLVGPYILNLKSKTQFRTSLRYAIRSMIELESLAREGEKQGLAQSSYVIQETRMWRDHLLANAKLRDFSDADSANHPDKLNKQFEDFLVNHYQKYDIEINNALLEQIQVITPGSDVVIMKQHFPGRMVAPPVLPVHLMPRWVAMVKGLCEGGDK